MNFENPAFSISQIETGYIGKIITRMDNKDFNKMTDIRKCTLNMIYEFFHSSSEVGFQEKSRKSYLGCIFRKTHATHLNYDFCRKWSFTAENQ